MKFATFFQALLHRVRDNLMRMAKGNTALCQIGGGGHGVHKTFFAGPAHGLAIEAHLPHEAMRYFHAVLDRERGLE